MSALVHACCIETDDISALVHRACAEQKAGIEEDGFFKERQCVAHDVKSMSLHDLGTFSKRGLHSMLLSELRVENFRMFGEGDNTFILPIRSGLTALIGENDSGKTAVIDAIRLALGTRDQTMVRVDDSDFHQSPSGNPRSTEIRIRCRFDSLTQGDREAFIEYLTYEEKDDTREPVLYVNWKATERTVRSGRKRVAYDVRSGAAGDGPTIDLACRELLASTYLRPLRDAERALASGRGSRLSQILQNTKEIREYGDDYDAENGPPDDLHELSVLGVGSLADALLANHKGVQAARDRLNDQFLGNLSFSGSPLKGYISVGSSAGDDDTRLRQLLEKLDLDLRDEPALNVPAKHGLGSNNLLFMACELLLVGSEEDGLPLLLMEEPEAHLHPQRQLRLMQFLQRQASRRSDQERPIQIIITTHSPNLASVIDLDNLVLMHKGRAYPLARGYTELDESDYGFLKRFLDVTKSNLFFARGVMIVEGDAENILLPALATLLGRDFSEHGVSIVNVGGTGLRRFARIFLRKDHQGGGEISIPVACVADLDVMPDCAPIILGKASHKEGWPASNTRRWRARRDFNDKGVEEHREEILRKAHSQHVETFVADEWTFEYDLAFSGLAEEVWIAARLAKADEQISRGKESMEEVIRDAQASFAELDDRDLSPEELASNVYASIVSDSRVSKATTAQYLAWLLERRACQDKLEPDYWEQILPPYLVKAIDYVTRHSSGEEDAREETVGDE